VCSARHLCAADRFITTLARKTPITLLKQLCAVREAVDAAQRGLPTPRDERHLLSGRCLARSRRPGQDVRRVIGLTVPEGPMFRVDVDGLQAYFNFDPERKTDLLKLDALIKKAAPGLKRYFHAGTPAGEAGMRMKMIGYGKFRYAIKSGKTSIWPVV